MSSYRLIIVKIQNIKNSEWRGSKTYLKKKTVLVTTYYLLNIVYLYFRCLIGILCLLNEM